MATDVEHSTETARVAREYFEALGRADSTAPPRFYAPGAKGHIHGVVGPVGAEDGKAFFDEVFGAFPDWRFEVLDVIAEGERAAVRWRARGTFAGPGTFLGFEPNGARTDIEGQDMVWVRDGRIQRLEAYMNGAELARQLGALPAAGSPADRRLAKAFNLATRAKRSVVADPEPVADGVWVVRGGFPMKTMNVFLVRDGDGVLAFDAGIRAMVDGVAAAAASLGGLTRIVLGHGHPDHRGVASSFDVPVLCHADNREDAEGDGGFRYFDFSKLKPYARVAYPYLLRMWDGGPVRITDTVAEGDDVAGFEVVLIPGHAPGMIALWRAADRLALTSDCFYTLDPQTGRHGPPRAPHDAFNPDPEQTRASIRKIAALEPATAWPGHAEPLTGDVRAQLERAAAET
jgi:glyoxylase-like metal-dependent hydrolase (beta-lactamase superfamily II)/predicted ester cyclase